MSIDYRFGIHSEARKNWATLYAALSKEEQDFMNQRMPLLLLACGIHHISLATIPHIIARLKLLETSSRRTFLEDLRVLHLLVAHGPEAVETYITVREKTYAMLRDALPKDFDPDPAEAIKRFIGLTTNIQTEPGVAFLRSLTRKVTDPFPPLTSAEASREQKAFFAWVKAVEAGTEKHPILQKAPTA